MHRPVSRCPPRMVHCPRKACARPQPWAPRPVLPPREFPLLVLAPPPRLQALLLSLSPPLRGKDAAAPQRTFVYSGEYEASRLRGEGCSGVCQGLVGVARARKAHGRGARLHDNWHSGNACSVAWRRSGGKGRADYPVRSCGGKHLSGVQTGWCADRCCGEEGCTGRERLAVDVTSGETQR
eukprot:scaffold5637_cov350-Prasinococcus_capsulatus_cf.AAC.4